MKIELPEKRYYGIGEVAKAFSVNNSLIRFWEKEFDLELIYPLVKERGFTLEGAKTHLKENKHKTISNFEIIRKLETVKTELLKIKDHL